MNKKIPKKLIRSFRDPEKVQEYLNELNDKAFVFRIGESYIVTPIE